MRWGVGRGCQQQGQRRAEQPSWPGACVALHPVLCAAKLGSLQWGRDGRLVEERDPGPVWEVCLEGRDFDSEETFLEGAQVPQLPLEIALFNMQSTAVFGRRLSIHHPMQIPTLGTRSPCKSLDSPNQVCMGDSNVPREQHRAGNSLPQTETR